MQASRTKNTILNSSFGVLTKLVTVIVSFVSRTVFIRVLGVQYAGVSTVFTDILTVLSFAELGIGSAITFALYKPLAENDNDKIASLMAVYKKVYRIIALVVFVAGMLVLPFLEYIVKDVPDVKEDIRLIYVFYIINTASSYLLVYKSTLITAAQKDYVVSLLKILVSVVRCAVECVLLLVFRQYLLYLIINIVSVILQNFIVAKKADKMFPFLKSSAKEKLPKEELKKIAGDVKALFLYKVSGVILSGTDNIIISAFLGVTPVGIIGNYNLIINQIYNLVMQVFSATNASVGNLAASGSKDDQYKVYRRLELLCFCVYYFIIVCFWNLLNPFVAIWLGGDYLLPKLTVALVLTDLFLKGMMSPVTSFRTSNGLFVQGKYRPLIMAVLNIVISLLLVKPLGVNGVIIGTIGSRLLTQIWFDPWLIYRKIFGKSSAEYFLRYIARFALMAVSCALIEYLCTFIQIDNLFADFAVKCVATVVIGSVILLCLFGRTEDFKYYLSLIKKTVKGRIK